MTTLKINPRFKELCRRLTEEEFSQLEANIVNLGRVREEILVWKGQIIDGHNRYEIATKHGIKFDTAEIDFTDENAACNWIIHNQLGRRNLNPVEASYLRGKLYLSEKSEHGGDRNEKASAQNAHLPSTAAKVASETGVSAGTVIRDATKAEAIDKLPPAVREGILSKKYTATAAAIKKAGAMSIGEIGPVARKLRVGEASSLDEALGMKKPTGGSKVPESAPVGGDEPVVLDHFKVSINGRLASVFSVAPEFRGLMKAISDVKSAAKTLSETEPGGFIDEQELSRLLITAHGLLRFAMPYTECAKCRRKIDDKCPTCKGRGWVNESLFKTAFSDADKSWLDKRV